ncbi:hypothetical protein [Pseudonocardia sp. TMWB2A]|uniref:hypothetical protein n=1 Tax=Pseudonocardia sp. TMWB2A TaxID=687430 RepID=UPI00307F9ACC
MWALIGAAVALLVAAVPAVVLWRRRARAASAELAGAWAAADRRNDALTAFQADVERARRAGGPWPEPTSEARRLVDQEESDRRNAALCEAMTQRLRAGAQVMLSALLNPRAGQDGGDRG